MKNRVMKEEINEPSNKPGPERGGLTFELGSQRRPLTKVSKDKLNVNLLKWAFR